MEPLYADNLVLCGESLDEFMGKYEKWNKVLERKGLRAWYPHTFEHPTSGLYFPIGLKLVSFKAP